MFSKPQIIRYAVIDLMEKISHVSNRHTSCCTHQSGSTRSNKSSKQNFVVELKTLFFLIVILFYFIFLSRPFYSFSYRREAWHGGGFTYRLD